MTDLLNIQARSATVANLPLIPTANNQVPVAQVSVPEPVDSLQLRAPAFRKGEKVLVIGDSHTVGPFGSRLDEDLRQQGAVVATYGSCGTRPADWFSGNPTHCGFFARHDDGTVDRPEDWQAEHPTPLLPDLLRQEHPDLVVIALGANFTSVGDSTVKTSAAKMVQAVTGTGAQCVWVGPPNGRASVVDPKIRDATNDAIQVAVAGRALYIDSRPFTHYPASGGDGRHYGGTEGTRIAKGWADAVAGIITGKPR